MVQLASTLLLALAASASARRHFDRREAQQYGHGHKHTHKHHRAAGTGVPYPAGNATDAGAATGTVTSLTTFSTTTVAVTDYVTVSPVPQANNAAAAGSGSGSGSGSGGNGAAPAGGAQCGPATVTVTAPASTVTVTAAAPAADTAATTTTTVAVTTSTSAAATSSVQAAAGSNPAPAAGNSYSSENKNEVKAAAPANKQASQPSNKQAAQPANKQAAAAPAPKIPTSGSSGSGSGSGSGVTSVGGGKRGVGYNAAADLAGFDNSGVTWAHNWAMTTDKIGLEFVPTFKELSMAGDFESNCNAAIAAGSKALFTFNEPDMTVGNGGTAIAPGDAAAAYIQHVNPFKGKIALATPSVTSDNSTTGVGGGPSGMFWLQQFLDACNQKGGCHIDIVNLHWYGNSDSSADDTVTAFKTYVTNAKAQVADMFKGQPTPEIWFSEFSAEPTADQDLQKNLDFLGGVMGFLDQNVDKYAYFMAQPGQLVDSSDNSKLSSLGSKYASGA